MRFSIDRRTVLGAAAIGSALAILPRAKAAWAGTVADQLAALEAKSGGRLGVAILDAAKGETVGHRLDERFPLCSTFKFVLAAAILARADRGQEDLGRRIAFTAADLVGNSPICSQRVGDGMTVAELGRAAMALSDNTAANLLLPVLGGPPAVTAFAAANGDTVTRLDHRVEADLNVTSGADPRDTTSPAAMAGLMQTLVLGKVLSPASREILIGWLCSCRTGLKRLAAGLPEDWLVGRKTGTGMDGPTNDIAICWPPKRAPLIVTAYFERTGHKPDDNNAVLTEAGRIAAASA